MEEKLKDANDKINEVAVERERRDLLQCKLGHLLEQMYDTRRN